MPPAGDAPSNRYPRPRSLVFPLFVMVALACAAIGHSTRPISAAAQPTLAVDVDPATAGAQSDATYPAGTDEIGIEILALNAAPTGAFEFELSFDANVLAYRRSSAGPFLSSTGRMLGCVDASTQHTVAFGCASSGPAPPDGAVG